jgi:hypothetical protein
LPGEERGFLEDEAYAMEHPSMTDACQTGNLDR